MKKKHFIELPRVSDFMTRQSRAIQLEYADIVNELELNSHLKYADRIED